MWSFCTKGFPRRSVIITTRKYYFKLVIEEIKKSRASLAMMTITWNVALMYVSFDLINVLDLMSSVTYVIDFIMACTLVYMKQAIKSILNKKIAVVSQPWPTNIQVEY